MAVLQFLGALNVLLYPGVFLAGIMSLAAVRSPQPAPGLPLWQVFLWASLVYPLLWLLLWLLSWLGLWYGRPVVALLLSLPPALATVLGGGFMLWQEAAGRASVKKMAHAYDSELRDQNPLVADIAAFDMQRLSWPDLQKSIAAADPTLLSKPAGLHGTPLRLALVESGLHQTFDMSKTHPHCLEAARLLLTRGATLSAQEQAQDYQWVWMAGILRRGVTLPDRRAQAQNPVAWAAVYADSNAASATLYAALRRDPALLNEPTSTYGTPLAAALLRNEEMTVYALVSEGAELSGEEQQIPSLGATLEKWLSFHSDLKEKYATARQEKHAGAPRR